jgi:hypothetical protein
MTLINKNKTMNNNVFKLISIPNPCEKYGLMIQPLLLILLRGTGITRRVSIEGGVTGPHRHDGPHRHEMRTERVLLKTLLENSLSILMASYKFR